MASAPLSFCGGENYVNTVGEAIMPTEGEGCNFILIKQNSHDL